MRVVFLGNDPWSVASLDALNRSELELALVVTRVPRPAGRGSKLTPTSVAVAARALGLPLAEVETVRSGEGLARIRGAGADLLAVVAYGEILPADLLSMPRLGCVNVHFSLLPRWRGASPARWTILAGDQVAGVTTMLMDEGLDTGPILLRSEVPVAPEDDAGSLGTKLAELGGRLLVESVEGLAAGEIVPAPQPLEGVTYAPKLTAEDRWIDWSDDAGAVGRRVRALSPEPGASTRWRGEIMKVLRGEPGAGEGDAGAILGIDGTAVAIGTRAGVYRLLEVAPAGRRRMEAAAWARGTRPAAGEHLG
ncbi:MAG: methionyl-tRNA formyltransferase [Actinobacteria bacterium]|nr:methionyl-tRNA formyltransferase [Actinomycetota bacterium]